MPSMEAMRLYVRTLEEENPNWWTPDVAAAWESAATSSANAYKETNGTSDHPSTSSHQHHNQNHNHPSAPSPNGVKSRSVADVVVEGSWVSPYISSDRRPPPRYEQALCVVGNALYVIGGNCGGRYLNDTWALNMENLTWKCIAQHGGKSNKNDEPNNNSNGNEEEESAALLPSSPVLPPLAGLAAIAWNGNIVCLGGHTRVKDPEVPMAVRLLDTAAGAWSSLATTPATANNDGSNPADLSKTNNTTKKKKRGAPAPPAGMPGARGGHSATLIGSKVYIFGGEDLKRKPSDELWVLDLTTLEWEQLTTSGQGPSPRSAHTAIAYRNRYILVFGGGSVATCFDDVWLLDTQTMEWTLPEIEGQVPPPRAGHAAAVLGSSMFVVGGGNNSRGCADMYNLDLSNLGMPGTALQWILVGNTPPESAIASEGLGLLSVPMAGCVISFGGYNGKYHNAVHVYRPEGYVLIKSSAAVHQHAAGAGSSDALTHRALLTGLPQANSTHPLQAKHSGQAHGDSNAALATEDSVRSDIDAARREATAAKEAVALELSIMRRQLDSATAALAESERSAEEAKEALSSEQEKSMKLEVEIAELKQKVGMMNELTREIARLRQRLNEETSTRSGLWGYITGSDAAAAATAANAE